MRTLCLILCVCDLGTAQTRSVTDGVYSAGQAARGQDIYQTQCSSCHGKALVGRSGPPLVGDGFLSNWSERPLTNVVDKIQKTMPFNKPGSLSRQQSIDLAAYIDISEKSNDACANCQSLPRQGRHRRKWSHSVPAASGGEITCA